MSGVSNSWKCDPFGGHINVLIRKRVRKTDFPKGTQQRPRSEGDLAETVLDDLWNLRKTGKTT